MSTAEAPELSRRERRKFEVRTRILESAMALFDERGFTATTVAQIAERADVAQKTLFNHFDSKQELLRHIAENSLAEAVTHIQEVTEVPGTTRERIAILFRRIADDTEEAGPMRRELLTEIIHTAQRVGSEAEQSLKLHDAFGAIVREGRRAGDVSRAHTLQTQTELLVGSFYVLMFNWAHLEDFPLRRQALATAAIVADALEVGREGEKK